ncbi:CPBP family intramembrane metalloprotease [Candidatus Gottesmanbacteria bacterium]|nr:CPBP family intramembrane metalloprotease [Candidatus Gottesmanbacteria bacterium]
MKNSISAQGSQETVSVTEKMYRVWGWIVLVWALYRYFFKLPEWADEFIFKPMVFALPVIWYVRTREKRGLSSVGLTGKNLFTSIYIGLGFGFVFAIEGLFANAIKYGKIEIMPIAAFQEYGLGMLLLLSAATAFSEELLSRGFVFTRLIEGKKSLIYAAAISTLMFVVLHVPILAFSSKLTGVVLLMFFVTDFVLGFANALLLYNTGSLIAPILVHVFWNMTVALYL